MVLIIRNNRIQSRRHCKIKHLWSHDVDNSSRQSSFDQQYNKTESGDNNPTTTSTSITTMINRIGEKERLSENRRQVRVLAILFLYSVAMFTLPFAAFYATQYIMNTEFHATRFTNSCVSSLAAVITVNLIVWSYAYRAFFDPDEPAQIKSVDDDNDDEKIDKSVKSNKNHLNLKED